MTIAPVPSSASASPAPRADRHGLRLLPGGREPRQLALDYEWEVGPGITAVPATPTALRLVTDEPDWPDGLQEPGRWAAKLALAIAEVSVGARPAAQLTRHVARDELARLSRRGAAYARHPATRVRRAAPPTRTVRAVRTCPVAPGVVETSAVLVGGGRAQAIAIRLEAVSGRWLATAVEMR